ncbi:hypothetical protein [Xenorhabdus griffiniae]|uniref:Cytoplasmic protein n=1 Tax=Xenorhabdus griffiniae TaxID=351672 RepID=A0ABY9XFI5_9GAMM|nr:hypothetical protein [Xenorhabdus griffiniae]WMV71688.1 hypothetical protein QL128_16335 [Xenorhabdus griffiniae]WNH01365.1 hypothetical protein QL112_016340 [Xenorhabdus griffiniae]
MKTLKPIEVATALEILIEPREVYVVRGANKAYLSEGGALNKLAYVRAQEQFNEEGKESNFPAKKVKQEDGTTKVILGSMRPEFIARHAQVLEELKDSVKRERDLIRTKKEHLKAIEKHRKAQDELIAIERKIHQLQSK